MTAFDVHVAQVLKDTALVTYEDCLIQSVGCRWSLFYRQGLATVLFLGWLFENKHVAAPR